MPITQLEVELVGSKLDVEAKTPFTVFCPKISLLVATFLPFVGLLFDHL